MFLNKNKNVELYNFEFTKEYKKKSHYLQIFYNIIYYNILEMFKKEKYIKEKIEV